MGEDILTREVERAEFRVGELFDFYGGRDVCSAEQKPGKIPYVSATSNNNGIDAYISNPVYTISGVITISAFGDVFYHPYRAGFSHNTHGVQVKKELKEDIADFTYLYLAIALKKAFTDKGSFNKRLTDKVTAQQFITLPVTEDGNPDWDYMEEYMIAIKKKHLAKVEAYNRRNELILNGLISS